MLTVFDHLLLWGAFTLAGFFFGLFLAYTLAISGKSKL